MASLFTPEIASTICTLLADGKSLRQVCEGEGMPSEATVRSWALDDIQGFAAQYTRAREIGYERLADEILRIADTPEVGIKTTTKATGVETVEGDMIEHRRLQVDARKWMLSKMLPKKYGDKIQQEHSGSVTVTACQSTKRCEAYGPSARGTEGFGLRCHAPAPNRGLSLWQDLLLYAQIFFYALQLQPNS